MDTDMKAREIKVLKIMREEIAKNGFPPTVRELCEQLKIKSTSTIFKDIERLEKKGYIIKNSTKPRALRLTAEAHKFFGDEQKVSIDQSRLDELERYQDRIDVVDLPVLGQIAAGQPIMSDDHIEDHIPVPSQFIRGENFLLRINGDSMVEAGIYDGDYVMIRKQITAEDGDIAAVIIDDGCEAEATVKTFYNEGHRIRLQPENSLMDPIYVDHARVLGLVKGVFRFL